jgi:hypothetical protein
MVDDGKICSFRDLDIWKRSVDLAERIYATTKSFPPGGEVEQISKMTMSLIKKLRQRSVH